MVSTDWFLQVINSSSIKWLKNKTAGHHWHIFCPPFLLRDTFQKDESVLSKKYYLQQILIIFPNLKFLFFWFLQKTLNSGGKKTFLWNNIWYVFYSKFATFTNFVKIQFFPKKPIFVHFEKSYCFSRILRQFCYNLVIKIFHGRNRRTSDTFTSDIINWQVSVKITFGLCGWFSSHIINMAEIMSVQKSEYTLLSLINGRIPAKA